MVFGILFMTCATFGTSTQVECDVRVMYNYNSPTQIKCSTDARIAGNDLVDTIISNKGKMNLVALKTDCLVQDELKMVLNALPEFMADNNRTYKLTFY